MNRLLIVDDEHHIVNWLSELFQSVEDLDLEIMKAYSGFEMLNILKNYRMDIILLDIQMPGMDGLAAAQEALSEWPSTHIIFLTAYDNFHYLYQANQLPNTSYLLKTEDDETIVCTIRKVLEQIQLKTDTQNALEQATADKLLLDHLLQQDFLRTLIHGNYNQINILISGRQKRLVPIDFTQEVCLLLTCRSGASSLRPAAAMSNNSVIACLSFIKNLVYDKFSFCMLELDAESMLWFFQDNRPQERRLLVSTVNFLRNVSDDLAGSAEKHLHCHISNFLLTSPVSWRELAPIVHQLQCYGLSNMHQNAYHISSSNTVPLHSLDARASSPEQMDTDTVLSKTADELSFYLYQKDRISYMELLAQASRKCGMVSSMHDLFVIQLYSSIALVLIRYISQYHLEKEISLKIAIHPLYYIQDFPNWQKAFQYLTSLSEHLFALMSDAESNRNEHLVSIVEKYINENLTRPLSLSDVASCINYNATYVARLYKQLRGISLTDYITKCRIQKAITLLVTTNDSIQSIAKETGFDTSQYFSIVFKKEVGMPPRDYRATH